MKKKQMEELNARFEFELTKEGGLFRGLALEKKDRKIIKNRMKKALKKTLEHG